MAEYFDKEKYESGRDAHIKYINEQYKAHNLELIKTEDLKKLKRKKYFSGFLTGFFILIGILGILALSGVLLYLGNGNKLKSELICGNQTCENNCPAIPSCPSVPSCPACSNTCNCPDFPSTLKIKYLNETS